MPPRFVRQAVANNTAQSLVLIVKLGVRFARRLAARIPSSKLHIPFISTPAQAFVSGVGTPPQSKTPSRQSCEIAAGVFVRD